MNHYAKRTAFSEFVSKLTREGEGGKDALAEIAEMLSESIHSHYHSVDGRTAKGKEVKELSSELFNLSCRIERLKSL